MKVLCVGSPKGGVGKSTIAVNIAASISKRGGKVLLVDTDDKQASSLVWRSFRPTDDISAVKMVTNTIHKDLQNIGVGYDVVVIDSGGKDDKVFRSAMFASDILLIPVLPSVFDVCAAEDAVELLKEADAHRNIPIKAYFLLNQIKETAKVGKETRDKLAELETYVPLLQHKIHDYTAYKNCLNKGFGVVDMKDAGKAAGEIDYLVDILELI